MASSDPESLGSASSLPQWMKTKASEVNKRDFDAQFASPPAHDDSFFLIRYPGGVGGSLFGSAKTSAQGAGGEGGPRVVRAEQQTAGGVSGLRGKDWSRHTQPCQQFISGVPIGLTKCPPTVKPKPAGTDDGFKGEGAACGSSIVRVAHQMISGRSSMRGTSVEPQGANGTVLMTKGETEGAAAVRNDPLAPGAGYNLAGRRGSRSLPVTPLSTPPGSPGSRRKNKNSVNRFFTGPFELPNDVAGGRSWILAGLLGQQREAYQASTNTINEESHTELTLAQSVENLGPAPPKADSSKIHQQAPSNTETSQKTQVYRPKPSELREMNFWSPTSM